MVDYHMHTPLCGHASGNVEEYVGTAIAKGFRDIGFSDHAPMPEPIRKGLSMSPDEVEEYIRSVEILKNKFSTNINVRLGFEVDYPLFETFDSKYFADPRIDYVIGSCHFVDGWAFDHPAYIDGYNGRDIDELYGKYYSQVEGLVGSGIFDLVGHFDVIKKFGDRSKKSFKGEIEKIARTAAQKGVAVEINTNGVSHPVREIYPSDEIIAILFDCNVPVTFGSDAHSPDRVGFQFEVVVEKIMKAGYRKISGFSKRKRYDILL
jgi:histidinol-phosphatase (PHP family)